MTLFPSQQALRYTYGRQKPGDDVLWRCEAHQYAYCVDPDFDDWGTTPPRLEMMWIPVLKRTPCGAWIGWSEGERRFVKLTAVKQYASNTEAEALENFYHRRLRQVRILRTKLGVAKVELELARWHIEKLKEKA